MKLRHLFIPHTQTHKSAYLISKTALLLYIFLFLTFNLSISVVSRINPNVLGLATNLNQQNLITLTNAERAKNGLSPLKENANLNMAAYKKGLNMLEENYWAHFSPSGKSPWDFILGSGYKFSYAGENLARNFYSDTDAVNAWMASPTHKDNILNAHYQEIGMSIVEGTLNGQPTVLIVQEFGTPVEYLAQGAPAIETVAQATATPRPSVQATLAPKATPEATAIVVAEATPIPASTPATLALVDEPKNLPSNVKTTVAGQKNYFFDPYLFLKNMGLSLFMLIAILIALDLYIIRRRGIVRLSSHHWPRLAMIVLGVSILINLGRGTIL